MKSIRMYLLLALMVLTLTIFLYQALIGHDIKLAILMLSNCAGLYFFSLIFFIVAPGPDEAKHRLRNNFFYKNSFAPMYVSTALLVILTFMKPEDETSLQIGRIIALIGFLIGIFMRVRSSRSAKH